MGGPRDPERASALRAQIKAGPDANYARRANGDAGSAINASWQAGHYEDAVKAATPLANQGDAHAQALLTRAYYQGLGVAQNFQSACYWAQRAADANDKDGFYFLGECYENGRGGLARNLTKASDLYDRAIDLGSMEARSAKGGIDFMIGRGRTPSSGPTFCNKGASDGAGGCLSYETGQSIDPSTGKPLY